jgi:hypothetical protein
MRYIAGAKACGYDQGENAQLQGAEGILFCVVRFHDFKFEYWIGRDCRGLMDFSR